MDFNVFDKEKAERYAAEAEKQWGGTDAYREYRGKSKDRTGETEQALGKGLMEIFVRFGAIKDADPASPAARTLVKELREYITANYYTCTEPILAGLGQMYSAGGEMTENIDKAGGEGTAAFAAAAINAYLINK